MLMLYTVIAMVGLVLPALPALAADAAPVPTAVAVSAAENAPAINHVPYISTYYIQPKVEAGKDVTIAYYVTDYQHSDYMRDDHTATFTIDYWVNGEKHTARNVRAGDNKLILHRLSVGEVLFAFQATDANGRTSHRLFSQFMVVAPGSDEIPADKVLAPDLAKFGIHNDNTHPVETTKGLTEMLKWAGDHGYRKVVLPTGTYAIDENTTVQMATRLTLDMNGSTFKLNPSAKGSGMMLEMYHCTDSHVINGTFQGDLKQHDFKHAPHNSEWLSGIAMGQDTRYCSFENLTVKEIAGYGVCTSIGGNGTRSYSEVTKGAGKFAPGDVDDRGNVIPSNVRTTSGLIDISKFVASKNGFFQLGIYLGYQGNPADTWVYNASFYDKDKHYLGAIPGFLYRRLYPPKNAHYARLTLYSTATPKNLSLFEFRPPYNCAFLNIKMKDIRCCAMVPSGFNNLLVDGCRFDHCGWAATRCAFDAEDGWDGMQDLFFRNNVFGENPANEFLTDAGHNFVMTGNTMTVYIRARTESYVFRNNTIKGGTFMFAGRNRTNFPRVYGNTFKGNIHLNLTSSAPGRDYCIRDNVMEDGVTVSAKPMTWDNLYCYKDTITGGQAVAKLVDCEIKGSGKQVEPHFDVTRTLTFNKPATASSFEGDSIPANAVDGFTNKKWGWWGAMAPASLTVDLGKIDAIGRIKVYTYYDGKRYYQYTVEVSTDGRHWTQVADMSGNTKPATSRGDTFTFAPVRARHVRVNMIKNSANGSVHIIELQVFPAQVND